MRIVYYFSMVLFSNLVFSMNAPGAGIGPMNNSPWPYQNYYNGNWGYNPYYYYNYMPPQALFQQTPTYFNWHSPSPYRTQDYDCPWCQRYQMQQNNFQYNNSTLPTWHSPMAS